MRFFRVCVEVAVCRACSFYLPFCLGYVVSFVGHGNDCFPPPPPISWARLFSKRLRSSPRSRFQNVFNRFFCVGGGGVFNMFFPVANACPTCVQLFALGVFSTFVANDCFPPPPPSPLPRHEDAKKTIAKPFCFAKAESDVDFQRRGRLCVEYWKEELELHTKAKGRSTTGKTETNFPDYFEDLADKWGFFIDWDAILNQTRAQKPEGTKLIGPVPAWRTKIRARLCPKRRLHFLRFRPVLLRNQKNAK